MDTITFIAGDQHQTQMNQREKHKCPFCEFEKLTEWFYLDRWRNIVVCRDKRDLGFKYRLLALRTGPQHHKTMPTSGEREELLKALVAVAQAHMRNGSAKGYAIDEVSREIPDHWHYQANMT